MSQSNNRLFRSQSRSKNKNNNNKLTGGEYEPTVDEQLSRLEEDIRRLKIEFDVFFNGGSKRPPYDTKGRVETMMKRLGDDRALSFAQRYRYNSLGSRYNAFRDLWRRTMQGREEGRTPMAAARANAKEQAVADFKKASFVCEDPHKDVELVKNVYSALMDAKKVCGEPVEDFSFPRFHRLIASQADSLKQRLGCERVSFSIDVEGGHVSFKARGEKG
ncbi:MAG: MXAN_5187 C-terminal domain-containing protein [Pyrinomonadaceae bacterium]